MAGMVPGVKRAHPLTVILGKTGTQPALPSAEASFGPRFRGDDEL